MIPKRGSRFSERIMRNRENRARGPMPWRWIKV